MLRPLSLPQATCNIMCAVVREVTLFANMTSLLTLQVACGNDKAACKFDFPLWLPSALPS